MSDHPGHSHSYRAAGVDIDAGQSLVERIRPVAAATARPGCDAALGGFGGLFDLAASGYRDPLLVAATDGVGTKLLVAEAVGRYDTVGVDLVAMCVNDLLTQGAEPLFFLDYFATGKLDVEIASDIVAGIAAGCREAGCGLIGGETAELPGLYRPGHYDLAGFAVGAVERHALITGADVEPGDVVLGLASSGLHANGFSLVRRIVDDLSLDLIRPAPFDSAERLGNALLEPTRIYAKSLRPVLAGNCKALAHITGGGMIDNVPRVIPSGLAVDLDATTWRPQPVFDWLCKQGGVSPHEMLRTFNCGIGMVVVAAPDRADEIADVLAGETVFRIGRIVDASRSGPPVQVDRLETAWGW